MRKERVLVTEMSDVDALQHRQLVELLDQSGSGCGSGCGSETQLYVKKGSGVYSIDGASYSIGISWSAGAVTGLYRSYISHVVNYTGKLEMISDSLNFTWGGGYTIRFTGFIQFKYWISEKEYRTAYHAFNDVAFYVPESFWG